jgi:3-deoxy-7-phosphoheptulonate synthase
LSLTAWSAASWRGLPDAQPFAYDDPAALERVVERLRTLPPLVTSWEIDRLRDLLADVEAGRRFLLQGGDCAETLADCRPEIITNKLKILLQMSLVLVAALKKPVVRVGRFAGQYAKPRSSPTERRGDVELPSYFGDLVNRPDFTPAARRADPEFLLHGYEHAALTLNFVRAMAAGGFADLQHPEYWELSFFATANLPAELRDAYRQSISKVADALSFLAVLGETSVAELSRVDFYTCHEALNLHYEAAQVHLGPGDTRHYLATTHLPWIGERTRALDGAHVELCRGIANPVGVKLGPKTKADDLLRLSERLNPENRPGRLVYITRLGAARVAEALPPLLEAVRREGRAGVWVCDPMHGNTVSSPRGRKTRDFDVMLREIEQSFAAHAAAGTRLGGVHFELTGEDVTECTGGAAGITDADLDGNYATLCDPRLNYRQALEMAFRIARLTG